ncbi:uncharacterized protein Eint_082000 [Encephalitozoon intestinalis ATCC 50506]|uniref:Uncharacterized protein n=1 Tax=Encephalitozoon intestinalis (strain ATCC 50506) TaxID=876142 RepID=E0S8C4_ENCIT|nr:uncharacterized protein Eint_082000 [Encephalitozoon intestinalis ATCC 50506]ADM12130.2 hypothetical protein Eint_082000 [Encephalitozoon intestinalis ATCC 50506]UTX46156.1 DUF2463 domain-containing protein [Encephalitozoon intestinalis]
MNVTKNLSQLKIQRSFPKKNQKRQKRDMGLLACLAIVLPAILYYLREKNELDKDYPLLKLGAMFPPFLYSAMEHFTLLWDNWKSSWKSLSLLEAVFYLLLCILFASISLVSVLSAIIFGFTEWDNFWYDDFKSYSIFTPSSFVAFAYLLSTSCTFTPELISFTDSGITIFFDLAILLCSIANLIMLLKDELKCCSYFSIVSCTLILVRSLREYFFPSAECKDPSTSWRVFILLSILLLEISIYGLIGLNIRSKIIN